MYGFVAAFRTFMPRMYTLKKSLGQHFLRDENMVRKIVQAIEATPMPHLLEVGPGGGALTRHLLNLPGVDFKAVELDEEKVQYLQTTYPAIDGKIIHQSILDMECPFEAPFMLVGNFPYNISSQILFKVLDWRDRVEVMVGMFQKEVAQRIAAAHNSKTYGILSVLVQVYYDVEYLFEVSEQCFTPPPKVKSAVIRLRKKKLLPIIHNEKKLVVLVKTAFNQRRKMLRNAVKGLFDDSVLTADIFSRRAEQLSVAEFIELVHQMR